MPRVDSIIGAVLAMSFFAAGSAVAGVGGSIAPTYPAGPVQVGSEFSASLTITNDSDGSNEADRISVASISHTPSCASGMPVCKVADPGVFEVSAGTGAGGSACAGVTFNVSTLDASTGEIQFTPASAWTLGPSNNSGGATACEIRFTVKVLKMPAADASNTPGVQTSQLARASFSNAAQPPQRGSAVGTSMTTVTPGARERTDRSKQPM
jgi:hypothetical protein